jgi:hypothetical protein
MPPEPLAGVSVLLESEHRTLRGVTDRYGTFEFSEPEPGNYTARLELPDRYYTNDPPLVRLPDRRACADLAMSVHHNGRVIGRVVDPRGDPISGLTLELTASTGLDRAAGPERLRMLTRDDGSYAFSRVPPGRFVIGVNTRPDPHALNVDPRVLHPGVRRLQSATVFTVEPGARLTLDDFVMPASVPYVRVSGVVLDADGYFAAGARVYLAGPNVGDALLTEPAITGASGRFVIAALAGREYRLLAERTPARDAGSRVDSCDPILVRAEPGLLPVRLKLRARY